MSGTNIKKFCERCGRPLRDMRSRQRELGPRCLKKEREEAQQALTKMGWDYVPLKEGLQLAIPETVQTNK